jgi:hypothetical protein
MSCSRVARSGIRRGARSALEANLGKLGVAVKVTEDVSVVVVVMMSRCTVR